MSNVVEVAALLPVAVALAIGLTATAQAQGRSPGRPGTTGSAGRARADVIDALAGDDRVGARQRGRTRSPAGEGLDRVWGGWGADRLYGGIGNDRLWGGLGADSRGARTATT